MLVCQAGCGRSAVSTDSFPRGCWKGFPLLGHSFCFGLLGAFLISACCQRNVETSSVPYLDLWKVIEILGGEGERTRYCIIQDSQSQVTAMSLVPVRIILCIFVVLEGGLDRFGLLHLGRIRIWFLTLLPLERKSCTLQILCLVKMLPMK